MNIHLIEDFFKQIIMNPQDFSSWTRKDWIDFDNIKNSKMIQTPEEMEQQKSIQIQNMNDAISFAFQKYGGSFNPLEIDKAIIWYATSEPTLAEFVGDTETWANNQIKLSTDLLSTLYSIVLNYP